MKLFISPTSPYARKARVVIHERGLDGRVCLVPVLPFEDPPELLEHSPAGKVPVLVTDEEGVLGDSRVICEYLDQVGPGPTLLPAEHRWPDRRRAADADAILDAAVSLVLEAKRPPAQQSAAHIARQTERIHRLVTALPPSTDALTLGDVAVVCALSYLDFRLPPLVWREDNKALASWHATQEERSSFAQTRLG